MKHSHVLRTTALICFLLSMMVANAVHAVASDKEGRHLTNAIVDTATITNQDTVVYYCIDPVKFKLSNDSVATLELSKYPFTSLDQTLKGSVAGVYAQQQSGEPGSVKENFIIRGVSRPVLTARNFRDSKPLVVVNGVQLIEDPDITYNIQNDEYVPIGAATNILSFFDLDNIESIHVLKDPSTTAIYGPRGANGVVYITTKNAKAGQRKISINGYTGFATPPNVTTINSEFERNFRQPFYDRYATEAEWANYPAYLSDSSNVNYYGPSNWVDEYYKVTPIYSVNGSLEGGSERSNFRFFGNHTKNASAADQTKLKRYYGAFYINMVPAKWMTISSNIQLGRLERGRNRSMGERYSETKFFPDLSTPLAPNKTLYKAYLNEYDDAFDDNINTSLTGQFALNLKLLKGMNFTSRVAMDYNENRRDLFWPSTLMSGNNYASNYFGYNERLAFDNILNYKPEIDGGRLLFEGGFNIQADRQKYNYIQAYRGPNDYIKINKVNGDKNAANYLQSVGFIPYLYSDKTQHRLLSSFLKTSFESDLGYSLSALIRRDGSSAQQSSKRWFTSYAFDGSYDFASLWATDQIDYFKISASYGRLGVLPISDTEASGLQYTSSLGWEGHKSVFAYNGVGTIARPYSSGWTGYDVPWSYNQMFNVGLDLSFLKQFTARLEYYRKDTKEVQFPIPTVAESGYKFEYVSGLGVNNQGVDLTVGFHLPSKNDKLSYRASLNLAYNTNELSSLPRGLEEIIVGKNKLKLGDRIDRYWLLKNEGIYVDDLDVPVRPADYKIMTYNGTDMKGGDPRWSDVNGDFEINNDDRQLMGNIIPKWAGGFLNQFTYKNVDLALFFYFNIGKDILNKQAARYYDFANVSESTSIEGVREITYWEKNMDETAYPIYNPWSAVSPYQVEQDMFLEDGSFLKLKNISFGYDLTDALRFERIKRLYVYVTGSNLWTYTKYSGRDPELINYYGYDTGAGIALGTTYTLGVKLDF